MTIKQTDWDSFHARCDAAEIPGVVHRHLSKTGEAFLSGVFRALLVSDGAAGKIFDKALPEIIDWHAEFTVPRGRVDYLLIHADGSATVCELKCGRKGKQHVLTGIGQCIGYAIQVGMANAGLPQIRKAVAFSSWGDIEEEQLVIDACQAAGVIAIPMGSENNHRESAVRFIEGRIGNGE